MDTKTVTYLPNMYEMTNSSAYQIATDTTSAHMEAANSGTAAFGSRVIGKSTRCCRENTFWRTIAAVAALAIAIKHRKGIGKALKAVFVPVGKALKNTGSWLSRLQVKVKPKYIKKPTGGTTPPPIKDLLSKDGTKFGEFQKENFSRMLPPHNPA